MDFGDPVGREQGYRRPSVIISNELFNRAPWDLTFVIPLTTVQRKWPSHVAVPAGGPGGLRQPSWAKVEDAKSVSQMRLVERWGHVQPETVEQINRILWRFFRIDRS